MTLCVRNFLLAGALLLLIDTATAQQVNGPSGNTYYYQHYTDDNGLVQNCINDLMPDEKGMLWLATHSGVQFFNGSRFFTPENQLGNEGFHNRAVALYRRHDTILVQTATNIIAIHAGKTVDRKPLSYTGYGVMLGNSNLADIPGHADLKKALYDLTQTTTQREHMGHKVGQDSFALATVHQIRWYNRDGIYRKVLLGNNSSVTTVFFFPPYTVYTNSDTLRIYNAQGNEVATQRVPAYISAARFITGKNPEAPRYWIYHNTIYRAGIHPGPRISFDTLLYGFPDSAFLDAIWQKDAQTIVASSASKGLFVFRKSPFTTLLPPRPNNQLQSVFYAQALLPGDTIVTGPNLQFHNGRYIGTLPALGQMFGQTVLADHRKQLWFVESTALYKCPPPYTTKTAICLLPGGAKVICESADGHIWVSDPRGAVLGFVDHDTIHRVHLQDDGDIRLMETLYDDPQWGMLAGTSAGIHIIPKGSLAGIRLPAAAGRDVRFIEKDRKGNYWIATYGSGFYLYRHGKVIHFPIDPENRLAYVHSVITDDKMRFLFLPTNRGLLMTAYNDAIAYADGKLPAPGYVLFDTYWGLTSNEFNGGCTPAYLRLSDGTISLPSTHGLVQFHPDTMAALYDRQQTNYLSVDNVWADGVLQRTNDRLCFPSNTQIITLRVVNPSWLRYPGSSIQYTLNPADDIPVWTDVPSTGLITITPMPYGRHHILFRSLFTGGSDPNKLSLYFDVAPQWYQTHSFYFCLALIVCLSILVLMRLRYFALVRRNKLLKYHVQIATVDILEANRLLKLNNMLKNRLLSALSHDIATPLQYIRKSLNRLMQTPPHTSVDKADINDIIDTVTNLEHLTDDLVSWSQLQQNSATFSVNREQVNLAGLIREKWKPLGQLAAHKHICLQLDFCEKEILFTDSKLLGIILYNVLSNAIKFSHSGPVCISTQKEEQHCTCIISIADSGKGFSPQRLQQVNSLLQVKPEKGTNEEQGKGIGLSIVRDLTHIMEGQIRIESVQGKGTTVHISLPRSYC